MRFATNDKIVFRSICLYIKFIYNVNCIFIDWCQTDYKDVGPIPIPEDEYKLILPLVMQYLTPQWVAVIGLGE